MKLRLDVNEKYPVYTVHEVSEQSTRLFAWDAIEMSAEEWQDYQAVAKAWDDWQKRLGKWMVERVPPTSGKPEPVFSDLISDAEPSDTPLTQYLGSGRVWDGRTKSEDDGA
jgi:hypothetical protein